MKKIAIIFLMSSILFTSCEKDGGGDTYDFSNSLAPNVELNSTVRGKTIAVKQGRKFKIPVLLRTAMQQNVDVSYTITGGYASNGTLTILRNSVSNASNTADSILIPVGTVPAASTTATAKFQLVSAKSASNDTLAVGRFGKSLEAVTLTISK